MPGLTSQTLVGVGPEGPDHVALVDSAIGDKGCCQLTEDRSSCSLQIPRQPGPSPMETNLGGGDRDPHCLGNLGVGPVIDVLEDHHLALSLGQ